MIDVFTAEGVKRALQAARQSESDRRPEDPTLQRLARVFRPSHARFTTKVSPGDDMHRHLYDATPQQALANLAAGLYGAVINPSNRWFEWRPPRQLGEDDAARRWCAEATDAGIESLGPSWSDFYSEATPFLLNLAGFGTAPFYSEFRPAARRFLDKAMPLWGTWVEQDVDGRIRTHHAKRQMTLQQLRDEYPDPVDPLPQAVTASKDPKAVFTVWMTCRPNPRVDKSFGDARSREFVSLHILDRTNERGEPVLLRRRGEDTSPWGTARWERRDESAYGEGRGHVALADALSLQVSRKYLLDAAAWASRPPILAPEEKHFRAARIVPAATVYGGMSRAGRPLAQALETGQRMPFAAEMTEQLREAVKEAFFFYVLRLVGRSGMSATEVAEQSQEKWRLMGPAVGALHADFLTWFLTRRFRLMLRHGLLPPNMPDSLRAMFAPLVDFVSPMAMAMRSADGVAAVRLVQAGMELAQLKPDAVDLLDGDATMLEYQQTFGARPHLIAAPAKVRDTRQARAERERQQAMIEAAGPAGQAAKGLADLAGMDGGGGGLAGLGQMGG